MTTRRPHPSRPVQLQLATNDPNTTDPTHALTTTALHLLNIQHACQLLHDLANQRTELNDHTLHELQQAFSILDTAGPLPGRLGYLTRHLKTGPVRNYQDIVDELAFALHLENLPSP